MKLAVLLGVLVFGLSLVAKAQAPIHAYKNMDEANADIQKFTQEIAINSKDAKLLCSRGDAYAFVAKWQEATADYTAAIEIDPQYAPAYLGRGWVNYGNRNFKDAVASLTEAIKLYAYPVDSRDAWPMLAGWPDRVSPRH